MEKVLKKGDCSITLRQCYADDDMVKKLIAYQPFNLVIMDKKNKSLSLFSEIDKISNIKELRHNYSGRQHFIFPLFIQDGRLNVDTEKTPDNDDLGEIIISKRALRLRHPEYKLMPFKDILTMAKNFAKEYAEICNVLLDREYYDIEIKKGNVVQTLNTVLITDKNKLRDYILWNIKFMDKEFDEILDELCK